MKTIGVSCLVSVLVLWIAMQMGSSATYFGFGLVVFSSIRSFILNREIRLASANLFRVGRPAWVALALFVAIASVVMLVHDVRSTRSWGELKWVFFLLGFIPATLGFVGDGRVWRSKPVFVATCALLAMTLFSSFAALYQFATATDPFREVLLGKEGWGNRGHGLLRNPVPFAKLMGCLALIGVAGFLTAKSRGNLRWVGISALVVVACIAAVLSSQARGVWLAFVVVGVFGLLGMPKRVRRIWLIGVATCAVLGCAATLAVPELRERAVTLLTDNSQKSNQTRLEQWHINWKILQNNPLGVGFDGNDLREDYWYEELGYVKRVTGHCHNEFIEIAVATGWPGLCAYLFVTGYFLVLPVLVLRKVNMEKEPWLALALMSSFLIQIFLNAAVMTDQMDTQSRMVMSLAWMVSLAGYVLHRKESAGRPGESTAGAG